MLMLTSVYDVDAVKSKAMNNQRAPGGSHDVTVLWETHWGLIYVKERWEEASICDVEVATLTARNSEPREDLVIGELFFSLPRAILESSRGRLGALSVPTRVRCQRTQIAIARIKTRGRQQEA